VGLVTSTSRGPFIAAFRDGLRERGHVEGRSVVVLHRSTEGDPDGFAALIAELLRLKVDVLVVVNNLAAFAAKEATATVPVVVIAAHDAVGTGLVASTARPGGNITGGESLAPELDAKRVELLKELVPTVSRLGVLFNPADRGMPAHLRHTEAAATRLGISVRRLEVRTPGDFDTVFKAVIDERTDALLSFTETLIAAQIGRIIEFAAARRLPAMYEFDSFVQRGGLIAYGPSLQAMFRHAALYVDEILKGVRPADLPIQQPTKFELTINLKTAHALGLTISPALRLRADTLVD
jgi:putative ABC transport system substrate-binding protein